MRARVFWIVVAAVFVVGAVQGTAIAAITKCNFNVWTTSETDANGNLRPLRVDFYVELEDSTLPPPEAFSVVTITAPGGIVFDFSANYWKYWSAGQRYFFFYQYGLAFSGGTIPTGTYKLTVKDKTGRVVSVTDTLSNNTALPLVTLTYPPATNPPAVVPLLNCTLSWSKVTGAQYYRVLLMDEGVKEYVYDSWRHNPMHLYNITSLALPKGALQANRVYTVRIEARDSDKNLSRRSRTQFVTFKTVEN